MQFGLIKYLFLAVFIILGAAFAWLVFAEIPVQQQEIVVNVPLLSNQQ